MKPIPRIPRIFRLCPKCGKKGVYYWQSPDGMDAFYRCKYCQLVVERGTMQEKALYVRNDRDKENNPDDKQNLS